jgi:hypothetical protein
MAKQCQHGQAGNATDGQETKIHHALRVCSTEAQCDDGWAPYDHRPSNAHGLWIYSFIQSCLQTLFLRRLSMSPSNIRTWPTFGMGHGPLLIIHLARSDAHLTINPSFISLSLGACDFPHARSVPHRAPSDTAVVWHVFASLVRLPTTQKRQV